MAPIELGYKDKGDRVKVIHIQYKGLEKYLGKVGTVLCNDGWGNVDVKFDKDGSIESFSEGQDLEYLIKRTIKKEKEKIKRTWKDKGDRVRVINVECCSSCRKKYLGKVGTVLCNDGWGKVDVKFDKDGSIESFSEGQDLEYITKKATRKKKKKK